MYIKTVNENPFENVPQNDNIQRKITSTREHHSTAFNKENTETFAIFFLSLFLFTDYRDHTASHFPMTGCVHSYKVQIATPILSVAVLREWLMNQP